MIWDDVASGSLWYHNKFWDFQFTNHEIPGSGGAALRLHGIDGDTVVFARDDGATWSLYRYTIGSDNDAVAFRTLPAGSEYVSVSVHDGRAVWTQKDALNNHSVYWTSVYGSLMNFVVDLDSGVGGGSPSTFHDGVAWQRNAGGQFDVRFGFQGGGGLSTAITNDANFDGFASLYGRRVVYEHPSGDTDLYIATAEPDFDR
ncbi:hypothetical protein EG835_11745, partial [bacterium]|nr:hypothetical protein [bacterium]